MDWRLLQLADSAFPAGSFAHSGGLEALHQAGLVSGDTLLPRLRELTFNAARSMLPFLEDAALGPLTPAQCARPERVPPKADLVEGSPTGERERVIDADRRCDAFLFNHVANRASRAQGGAFAIAAHAALGVERPELPFGHLAVVMGVMVGPAARELYVYGAARSALSAAVRLGIVGPLKAQALFTELHPTLTAALAAAPSEPRSISPVLELTQQAHDSLYSRLFQS